MAQQDPAAATLSQTTYRKECNWRFARLLRAMKLRQVDVAKAMNLNKQNVFNWVTHERLVSTITPYELYRFSRVFSCPGVWDWVYSANPGNLPARIAKALDVEIQGLVDEALEEKSADRPAAAPQVSAKP